MAINECIPKYEPGKDLTGEVSGAAVIGCRVLRMVGKQGVDAVSDDTSGGNILVRHAAPATDAGRFCGVSGWDGAIGDKIKVVRGRGKVVPIESGAAIAQNAEVEVDAQGRVVPLGTTPGTRAVGYAFTAATGAGQKPYIHLYD